MSIIITGSSGFLGEYLCNQFIKKKIKVIGIDIDRPKVKEKKFFEFHHLDLTKNIDVFEKIIKKNNPKFIVHTAAKILESKNENEVKELNTNVTKKIFNLVERYQIELFFFISTFSIYEKNYNFLVDENQKPSFKTIYGKTKFLSEKYLKSKKFKNTIVLRCPIIMGPSRGYRVELLSELIKRNLPIPLIGKCNNKLSFIHIDDVFRVIVFLIKSKKTGLYNISSDEYLSVKNILSSVIRETRSKSFCIHFPLNLGLKLFNLAIIFRLIPFISYHKKLFLYNLVLDITKIKKLGWKPKHKIISMFRENIYKANKNKMHRNLNSFSKKKGIFLPLLFFVNVLNLLRKRRENINEFK